MKKVNNFQIAKVQPHGIAKHASFSMLLLIKVLFTKNECISVDDVGLSRSGGNCLACLKITLRRNNSVTC